jgi:hypothetical protein
MHRFGCLPAKVATAIPISLTPWLNPSVAVPLVLGEPAWPGLTLAGTQDDRMHAAAAIARVAMHAAAGLLGIASTSAPVGIRDHRFDTGGETDDRCSWVPKLCRDIGGRKQREPHEHGCNKEVQPVATEQATPAGQGASQSFTGIAVAGHFRRGSPRQPFLRKLRM